MKWRTGEESLEGKSISYMDRNRETTWCGGRIICFSWTEQAAVIWLGVWAEENSSNCWHEGWNYFKALVQPRDFYFTSLLHHSHAHGLIAVRASMSQKTLTKMFFHFPANRLLYKQLHFMVYQYNFHHKCTTYIYTDLIDRGFFVV